MAWYSDWQYRKKLTVDYTKVSANETDFAVVVKLASDSDLASYAQADGDDILITSSDEVTKLSHALLKFNDSTGELYLIFKAPSLSSTVDTDFYLYFGKAGATAQEDPTGVFGTDYKGVWPLNESSGTRYDLTSNNNDLSDNNTVTSLTGKLDTGADFEKTNNEYLSISDASQTGLDISGNFSMWGWFNIESLPTVVGDVMVPVCKDNLSSRFFSLQVSSSDDSLNFFGFSGGSGYYVYSDANYFTSGDVGNWVFMAIAIDVVSKTNDLIYKNDTSRSITRPATAATSFSNSTASFELGTRSASSNREFDGGIENFVIKEGLIDSNFITTTYNNQNSPSTFYSLGTLESNGISTATVSPVTLTLTPTTTTATFTSVLSASVTPVTTTLTIVDPTATYVQVNTATVNPVALTLSTTTTTATSVGQQENYTREASVTLPADDTDLSTTYNSTDITNVESDNDVRVDLTGSDYLIHQFKYTHSNNTDPFSVALNVRSTKAPSTNPVYLQVYNRTSTSWETLATNNSENADTDFDLQGSKNSSLSDYYDGSNVLSFRVYQQV